MASAAAFTMLLEHPGSPVRGVISSDVVRRLLMGLAMGGTAIAIIYSPFGARSGAHMNPATTLVFARLGKIAPRDAAGYVTAQFVGGALGLAAVASIAPMAVAHPSVNYVATRPQAMHAAAAFLAETGISFLMMTTVLVVSNGRFARFTGLCAGALVATFITIEAPLSGMSMNPARSFAPALVAGHFSSLWIYFTAPLLGMAIAAEVFVRRRGVHAVLCARLNHAGTAACIFRCRMAELP